MTLPLRLLPLLLTVDLAPVESRIVKTDYRARSWGRGYSDAEQEALCKEQPGSTLPEIVRENCLLGSYPEEWDVNGAGTEKLVNVRE